MALKTLPMRVGVLKPRLGTYDTWTWRTGKTTAERGYDGRWKKEREQYLRLYPYCRMCLELDGLEVLGTVVDHKIPHRGDMTVFWDRTNWQTLCTTHHSRDKQRDEQSIG
jgi:5-methylcytosine-specific restriction endonuclease McrA